MTFTVYLLRCADGHYYCGHTETLELRIAQHQRGEIPGYTSTRLPVELVWSQDCASREEALSAERRIKGWNRRKKEALIRSDWTEISRLARSKESVHPSTSSGRTGGWGCAVSAPTTTLPHSVRPELVEGRTTDCPEPAEGPELVEGRTPIALSEAEGPELVEGRTHFTLPQFERTEILIGEAGLAKLAHSHIFLAGLGGVGSWCAEALARAGVGRLTLVDMDSVAVSNINRQLPATLSTVGQLKTEVMAARIRDIHPDCRLTIISAFITPENVAELLPPDVDYVVDCIDSLNCKLALIETALARGVPVAASMGAGNKLDPTRVRVSDIAKTEVDPLAREVRTRLRRRGVHKGVLCVWSNEPGRPPRPPEATSQGRARAVNGTISYLPPLFGLMLAGAVIQRLLAA